jgi:hypothetical protein
MTADEASILSDPVPLSKGVTVDEREIVCAYLL